MPENGIDFVKRKELLSYEEMLRILSILAKYGIDKVRITGGEPFLRKDLNKFLQQVVEIPGINKLRITTNGTLTLRYIPLLKDLKIQTINLSLDTLDKERFYQITRRDELNTVMQCFYGLLDAGIGVKVNMVVMNGINTKDIIPMIRLAEKYPVSIRLIEEMPFNGSGRQPLLEWDFLKIEQHIRSYYPELTRLPAVPGSTVSEFKVEGFKGNIGIIAAYSRTFCGTCNRIRITPQGVLKTCLYDNGIFNLRDLMRNGANDDDVAMAILQACNSRAKDGFEAEKTMRNGMEINESMASIGG